MKLSISLPDEDVAFLDERAARRGVGSRSSIVHEAIELLRFAELEDAYAAASEESDTSGDARLWDAVAADGLPDAPR